MASSLVVNVFYVQGTVEENNQKLVQFVTEKNLCQSQILAINMVEERAQGTSENIISMFWAEKHADDTPVPIQFEKYSQNKPFEQQMQEFQEVLDKNERRFFNLQ